MKTYLLAAAMTLAASSAGAVTLYTGDTHSFGQKWPVSQSEIFITENLEVGVFNGIQFFSGDNTEATAKIRVTEFGNTVLAGTLEYQSYTNPAPDEWSFTQEYLDDRYTIEGDTGGIVAENTGDYFTVTQVAPVPVPASLPLLGAALAAGWAVQRRGRRA